MIPWRGEAQIYLMKGARALNQFHSSGAIFSTASSLIIKKKMKVLYQSLIIMACGVMACSKSSTVLSQWVLKEQLFDPGNGSGQFQKVNSNKTIEFRSDHTIFSNGSLCSMDTESKNSSIGNYSMQDSTITPTSCNMGGALRFSMQDTAVYIYYPCIEPCILKYSRIN